MIIQTKRLKKALKEIGATNGSLPLKVRCPKNKDGEYDRAWAMVDRLTNGQVIRLVEILPFVKLYNLTDRTLIEE